MIEIETIKTKFGQGTYQIKRVPYRGKNRKKVKVVCPKCEKPRWVDKSQFVRRKSPLCQRCYSRVSVVHMNKVRKPKTGPDSYNWKGGTKNYEGYIIYHLPSDHEFRPMCDKHGRVREHRLVMAKHLGRMLYPWEVVHHKNRVRDDNRIENLELVRGGRTTHKLITQMQMHIEKLEERVKELEGYLYAGKENTKSRR